MGRVNLNGENVEPAGRFSLATKLAVLTPCGDAQEHAFTVVRIVFALQVNLFCRARRNKSSRTVWTARQLTSTNSVPSALLIDYNLDSPLEK